MDVGSVRVLPKTRCRLAMRGSKSVDATGTAARVMSAVMVPPGMMAAGMMTAVAARDCAGRHGNEDHGQKCRRDFHEDTSTHEVRKRSRRRDKFGYLEGRPDLPAGSTNAKTLPRDRRAGPISNLSPGDNQDLDPARLCGRSRYTRVERGRPAQVRRRGARRVAVRRRPAHRRV